ncbi:MAG TPA: M14 family metallocarboxypeptidase [Candidatus Paceibacterota bacterium]|nr:M14 family metallocarboxypeptidase [Candidatus Paceibacterota bacterium]
MALTKIRSYLEEVLEPLFAMANRNLNFSLEFMGFMSHELTTYPLYCVSITGREAANPKDILISGGVHGEEPAGVYSVMEFLERHIYDFLWGYRFLVFPCINPFGFEHGYRFNPDGVDINRQFKPDSSCHEAVKVMRVLSRFGRKFACTVDLHETDPNWADEGFTAADNPRTFYMWESCLDKSARVGHKVVEVVRRIAPVCDWPTIYGDKNSSGVIWYPEGCANPVYAQGTTLEAYLNAHYTPQSFTLETPCGWDMEKRIAVNVAAVRTILESKRSA